MTLTTAGHTQGRKAAEGQVVARSTVQIILGVLNSRCTDLSPFLTHHAHTMSTSCNNMHDAETC
jgi:hypothetical protein